MQIEQQLTMAYPYYMKSQNKGFTENLRAEVVNWLFKVHSKYRLWPETLYITVNLMDRYLSHYEITKEDHYLLAVTCLLIATKYEEIYPPTVKDFIKITNGKFNRE
jgi:cyclin A